MKLNLNLIAQIITLIGVIWSMSWFAGNLDKRISILELNANQVGIDLENYRTQQDARNDKQDSIERNFADLVNRRFESIEFSLCSGNKH